MRGDGPMPMPARCVPASASSARLVSAASLLDGIVCGQVWHRPVAGAEAEVPHCGPDSRILAA